MVNLEKGQKHKPYNRWFSDFCVWNSRLYGWIWSLILRFEDFLFGTKRRRGWTPRRLGYARLPRINFHVKSLRKPRVPQPSRGQTASAFFWVVYGGWWPTFFLFLTYFHNSLYSSCIYIYIYTYIYKLNFYKTKVLRVLKFR